MSSASSGKSSASVAAAKARAKVEAVRARTTFVKREAEVLLEKAKLEAELYLLQHEKEYAAAAAEGEILESVAAELSPGENHGVINITDIPQESNKKRTSNYVDCLSSSQDNEAHLSRVRLAPLLRYPSSTAAQTGTEPHTSFAYKPTQCPTPPRNEECSSHFSPAKSVHQPCSTDHAGMSDIARYLVRRELINSGLCKFDDRPENNGAWKSSFISAIQYLRQTASEELDLMVKWLGSQSSEHIKRLRAFHLADPAAGLKMAWMRLEECYGSPEIIEKGLFDKLDKFPKFNGKEPLKLRELGDLLKELEFAKLNGYLPGLSYLDTARGVSPIVNMSGRRATGFTARSLDGSCSVALPTLIECSYMPDDRECPSDSTVFDIREDDKIAPSIEDRQFIQLMDREMFMDDTNSWVAPLPFRSTRPHLPNNKEQALHRLTSLRRTLDKKPEMKEHFVTFMQKIFERGHAELAPPLQDGEEFWYLPVFGVYHPRKPGQIRVVFDSSAQYQSISLNDVLLKGPDLNNSLLGVLLRFRKEPVAITADIEQMFHSFIVRKDHRNFLRFLWFRDNDTAGDIVEYRMKVHVFGNSPSPAIAMYGLRRAALHGGQEFGSDARHFVDRDFYVDDGLKSQPSVDKAIHLLKATQEMLAISNLRLHKIASNSPLVMQAFPSADYAKDLKDLDLEKDAPPVQHSLGLSWNLLNDTFIFCVFDRDKPFTRRGVLATVNSVFDPLGLIAPVTVKGKRLLRELTRTTNDWDTPLPPDKEADWNIWRDSLLDLKDLKIPRAYTTVSLTNSVRKEMHVFADASTEAIAAVAYLEVTDDKGMCHVGFIMGKARLAPQSNHTIPRLELCAAVLAVEVAEQIAQELDSELDSLDFYTDSKVVLGYICNETRRFYVYVSNRVQRIRKFSRPEQWRYVPTSLNPADVATRSVPAICLTETSWLTGPAFLRDSVSYSAAEEAPFDLVCPESDAEVRTYITAHTNTTTTLGSHRFKRFSSWGTLVKATASLIHIVQSFKKKESCNVLSDRVKHQGRIFTEAALRSEGLWIVGAKRCVNSHLRKCIICKKLRGKTMEQQMAGLPPDRLSTEAPFTHVGLDVFGPWNVCTCRTRGGQANSKRWAVMFTCLSVRAVHIELIECMDSSSFINALRRFISLRGPVKQIRSDCGTNFRGACKELRMLLDDKTKPNVLRYLSKEGCAWIFNPPHSSHMGGAWERMIGISRRILDSMLSQTSSSCLTHEVLSTLMAEVCAIINARPIAPISSDPESPFLLTPAMILTQKTSSSYPPPGTFGTSDLYHKQWKRVQHLANMVWDRWRR
ncbi:hypothetical protein Q8A73_010400 [Channa argus]|nr:hypothetical protein Q8A73_010400 [Channa argus]